MPLSISQTTKAIILIGENVSLALLYAAARFNAFIVAGHADDATAYDRDRNSAFDCFTGEYRCLLEENLDQYREMLGQLKYQHLMPDRAN